jgi:hypothetical protein
MDQVKAQDKDKDHDKGPGDSGPRKH